MVWGSYRGATVLLALLTFAVLVLGSVVCDVCRSENLRGVPCGCAGDDTMPTMLHRTMMATAPFLSHVSQSYLHLVAFQISSLTLNSYVPGVEWLWR